MEAQQNAGGKDAKKGAKKWVGFTNIFEDYSKVSYFCNCCLFKF